MRYLLITFITSLWAFYAAPLAAQSGVLHAERTIDDLKAEMADDEKLSIGFIPSIGGLQFNNDGAPVGFYLDILNRVLASMSLDYYLIIIDPRRVDSQYIADRTNAGDFDMIVGLRNNSFYDEELLLTAPITMLDLLYVSSQTTQAHNIWPNDYQSYDVACIAWQVSCPYLEKKLQRNITLYSDLPELAIGVELDIDRLALVYSNDGAYLERKTAGKVALTTAQNSGSIGIGIGFAQDKKQLYGIFTEILNNIMKTDWFQERQDFWYKNYDWVNNPQYDHSIELVDTYQKRHLFIAE